MAWYRLIWLLLTDDSESVILTSDDGTILLASDTSSEDTVTSTWTPESGVT